LICSFLCHNNTRWCNSALSISHMLSMDLLCSIFGSRSLTNPQVPELPSFYGSACKPVGYIKQRSKIMARPFIKIKICQYLQKAWQRVKHSLSEHQSDVLDPLVVSPRASPKLNVLLIVLLPIPPLPFLIIAANSP